MDIRRTLPVITEKVPACRENDDGDLRRACALAQCGGELHAIEYRHLKVADDEIDFIGSREFKRDRAVPRRQHSETALTELERDDMHDGWLVINHKDGAQCLHL